MPRRRGLGLVDVSGGSMRPTLGPGDVVVVRWGSRIRAGAVVVAAWPEHPDVLVVKRAVRRADDGWWLEGDNPTASDDSRVHGAVPPDAVVGRVLLRLRRGRG